MGERDAYRRVVWFCAGAGLAGLSAVLVWVSFGVLTMMMDPALAGADYWAAVRERAWGNPEVTAFLILCCAGTALGLGVMLKAGTGEPAARPNRSHGQPTDNKSEESRTN